MMFIFVFLGLLICAEAEVIPLFQQTGKDLLLDLKEAVILGETDLLTWVFNGSIDIARSGSEGKITIFKHYLGRVTLPQNHSLLLRNLMKSDSGDYKARVSGDNFRVIAEYKVTVQDPVSPVNLTVKSCSSDFSNLTVSCSTQDSLISRTFTCDNQSCSEERGDRAEFTTRAASLKVYLKKDSIICVHSNQVSRTEDIRKIEDFCEKEQDPVSPVKLTVKSCSSDSSNLTVSCSTQDSLISRTFTCDNQSCSEERGDKAEFTTRAASLKVYLKKDSIICVHSNQVSRTEDIRKIEDFCEKEQDQESVDSSISVCKVKIIVISSGLIIMVCVVISVHVMEKVKKRK